MPGKVKTAAILYKILGWIEIIVGVILGLVFIIGGIAGGSQTMAAGIIGGLVYIVIMGGIGALFIWYIAKGIENKNSGAKIVGIIFGIIMLFGVPIGTVLGIFILIGLMGDEAKQWFGA